MYKVLEFFTDLQDNNFAYKAGATYPREGYAPSPERIAELLSGDNLRGRPVIAEMPEDKAETNENEVTEAVSELLGDEHTPEGEKPKRGRKKTNKE